MDPGTSSEVCKTHLILRADGNERIGLGHLFRSLALGDLLGSDFEVVLASRDRPHALDSRIAALQGRERAIPQEIQLDEEPLWMAEQFSPDETVLCIDGYVFGDDYRNACLREGFLVVVIDDLCEGHYTVDGLINHAPGFQRRDYSIRPGARFALGPSYALVHPAFVPPGAPPEEDRTFLCMGGADPDNHTVEILAAIREQVAGEIHVVLGAAYLHESGLKPLLDSSTTIHRGLSPPEMAALMGSCRRGVCSSSTVALEFAATGGDLYILQTADNQAAMYQNLLAEDYALPFSQFPNPPERKATFGKPAESIRAFFQDLAHPPLGLRLATMEDADRLRAWRNDPATVEASVESREVSPEEHRAWLEQTLADPTAALYVAEWEGQAVGTGRASLSDGTRYLSWTVAPNARGKGIGTELVLALVRSQTGHLTALVKPSNEASQRIAAHAGFKAAGERDGVLVMQCERERIV